MIRTIAMKKLLLAAALCAMAAPAIAANSPKGQEYEARYTMTGLLARAYRACPNLGPRFLDAAFAPIMSPEMKAVTKAYPKTALGWV
jgi:hypothetical protein